MSNNNISTSETFEYDSSAGDPHDTNSGYEFNPNPGGSFITTSTPPPSSQEQFVELEVIIGEDETMPMLFNLRNILNIHGPIDDEQTFVVETPLDEHVCKGNWHTLKDRLNVIATVWD